jgi:hypothetical protein
MSKEKKCTVCGKPSPDFICESCQSNIQAETVGRKSKMEKQVKVGGSIADKRSKQE